MICECPLVYTISGNFHQDFQFSSVAQSCPTFCNPMDFTCPFLSIANYQSLLKLMSFESVMLLVSLIFNSVCVWAQSCLTLCSPMDCSLPGSSVYGISWARMLEQIATSFSRGSSWPGTEPMSPALQADSLSLSHLGSPYLQFRLS